MFDTQNAFVTPAFLRSVWDKEFEAFKNSATEADLLQRLRHWAARTDLKETSAEAAFIEVFFQSIWGYSQTGRGDTSSAFTLYPKYSVPGAGARGGQGEADLAIGWFDGHSAVPQVLCEFKDIRSPLDVDQRRKGNTRSPVRQCLDYLSHARKGMIGSEPIVPTWAIVTDMNEFRLYWYDRGHQQHLGFVLQPRNLFHGAGLLAEGEAARFERFLFYRVFHRDNLLTQAGPCRLIHLIHRRRFRDREIENEFYGEYRALRDHLYTALLAANGPGTTRFPGTRGRLVRLAQKILDRLLFIFFLRGHGPGARIPAQGLAGAFGASRQ